MTKDEIFADLKKVLVEDFDMEEAAVVPEANIGTDLELDSIDAIDLIVKMKQYTPEGKPQIDASLFKSVKTVQDIVDALANVWA